MDFTNPARKLIESLLSTRQSTSGPGLGLGSRASMGHKTTITASDVNKDWTGKDKDQAYKDQDKDKD